MYDLEQAINDRRSTRMFLPDKQVPRELVDEALELAIHAPSNSNVQPWHLRLASGPARDRLVAALLAEATTKPPVVPELPELFAHLRRDLGAKVYGSMGITRDDTEGRRIAVLRNWEFFRAPLAGIVCMHRDLHYVDSLGVGMFLQTVVLALTARPRHLRAGVDRRLPRDRPRAAQHLRGVRHSVRAGDRLFRPDFSTNNLRTEHNPIEHNVVFHDA